MDFLRNALPLTILPDLVDSIMAAPNTLRKQLITLARYGDLPQGTGAFFRRTTDAVDLIMTLFGSAIKRMGLQSSFSQYSLTVEDKIVEEVRGFLRHPVCRGYVIALCTHLPLDPVTVSEEKLASYMKEVNVMDREGFDPEINWSPFFGNYHQSLHDGGGMVPNPEMAKLVHKTIDNWIEGLRYRVLDIEMSNKLLPTSTRQELASLSSEVTQAPATATQGSLEELYTKGVSMNGPCEVSQRWYTNGITPRTYFVAGPDAYNATKYTKDMWNSLVDALSVTNRFNRVNPSRIKVHGVKKALFYDLTSFTSNLRCQREFLKELATYTHGVKVTVRDTVFGLVERDLSDIISEYNTMNMRPEYEILKGPLQGLRNTHGPAGFLGVIGNIATANFIHGAFLLQFCHDDRECGCAGDDAAILVESDTDEEWFYGCISLLGILATDKVYRSEDIDVVYLKRKTWIDTRAWCLKSDSYVQIPSLLPFIPRQHELRFRERFFTRQELKRHAANSLKATFRSSWFLRQEDPQGYLRYFLERYYEEVGFKTSGNLHQLSEDQNQSALSYPSLASLFHEDYLSITAEDLYVNSVTLPDREEPELGRIRPVKGMTFETWSGGPHLRLLKKMGKIVSRGKVKRKYYGDRGYEELQAEFKVRKYSSAKLGRGLVQYTVVGDIGRLWDNEAWDIRGNVVDASLSLITQSKAPKLTPP
jgi:hypothetical protein